VRISQLASPSKSAGPSTRNPDEEEDNSEEESDSDVSHITVSTGSEGDSHVELSSGDEGEEYDDRVKTEPKDEPFDSDDE
jgi:hypothetical protein